MAALRKEIGQSVIFLLRIQKICKKSIFCDWFFLIIKISSFFFGNMKNRHTVGACLSITDQIFMINFDNLAIFVVKIIYIHRIKNGMKLKTKKMIIKQ